MSEYEARSAPVEPSSWAVGGYAFAIVMLMIIGVFQFIAGLVAIIDDDFYVVGQNYTFNFDTTGWGWIHILLGLLLILVGYFLYAGAAWAVVTAIVLAGLSAISNFFFIPYYPFWSIVLIALDVWVIWALTRPGLVVARA